MFQVKSLAGIAAVIGMAACGMDSQIESQIQSNQQLMTTTDQSDEIKLEHATVIRDVKVGVILGGFNPNYRGLEVAGTVQLGGNSCVAAGTTAALVESEKDGIIYLTPTLKLSEDSVNRVCTMEYMPVFANVTIDLRYDSSKITKVVIRNVEKMGRNRNANSFLN
jgi:hypothetical protein